MSRQQQYYDDEDDGYYNQRQQPPRQQPPRQQPPQYNAPQRPQQNNDPLDDFLGAFDQPQQPPQRSPQPQRAPQYNAPAPRGGRYDDEVGPPPPTRSQPPKPRGGAQPQPTRRPQQNYDNYDDDYDDRQQRRRDDDYDDQQYRQPQRAPQRESPQPKRQQNYDYDDEYEEPAPRNTRPKQPQQRNLVDEDYSDEDNYDRRAPSSGGMKGASRKLRFMHSGTHGSVRQVTVVDAQGDESDYLYRAYISLDPLKIKIEDKSNLPVIEIKQKLLALHPTFDVKNRGVKFGSCTQRFKVNAKKFNYERADNKQVLKMVGEYGHHFAIKKNEKVVAKVLDKRSELDVEIESTGDTEHIVCMCCIMLQQRFLGVMGGSVKEFQ
jgi:uncharacterized protein YxjI